MNEKLKKTAKSVGLAVADGVKIAAINMVGALVLKGAWELGKVVVNAAADAILESAEKAE